MIRSPFRNIQQCIETINKKIDDGTLHEISDMIRNRFVDMLKNQYGTEVYELSNDPLEAEGDFIVLADVRVSWLFALCGASYELERRYKIEMATAAGRPRVQFVSWIPMHCSVHCNMDTNTLTLMPMTAAILRFPETVRVRVEPLGPKPF